MIHELPSGRIIRARVEDVYSTIADGSVTLLISDGPYGGGIAEWDKVKDLAAWYRPHIAEWSRLCAPSASVYLWGTAEGWAAIHPEMVAAGWTFRALITWDKGVAQVTNYHMRVSEYTGWPDVTEVCGFYQRPGQGDTDDTNTVRAFIRAEVAAAGMSHADIREAIGVAEGSGMPGHYLGRVQWMLPTADAFEKIAAHAQKVGPPRERPYFVHPSVWPGGDTAGSLALLRRTYASLRPPFQLSAGVSNVWSVPMVGGSERLQGNDGASLHPCQKPLLFSTRMIEASSRPGDLVFAPFGGTCREAVACETLAHHWPEKARRYVCVEQDEDGRDYIGAVLRQIRTGSARQASRQPSSLFNRQVP